MPINPERGQSDLVDPDFWTIAQTLIGFVGMIAQLVPVAKRLSGKDDRLLTATKKEAVRKLKRAARDGHRTTCDLVRFLSGPGVTSLSAPYEFGATAVFVPKTESSEFFNYVSELSLAAMEVFSATHTLFNMYPEEAQRIAEVLQSENADIVASVRRLQSNKLTNEQVLDICLELLSTFDRALSRLEN